MADPIIPVDIEREKLIGDIAHQLMDLCNETVGSAAKGMEQAVEPDSLQSSAMGLAVQSLFMADWLGLPEDKRTAVRPSGQLISGYLGLGLGVGHCLASMQHPLGFLIAKSSFDTGVQRGLKQRLAADRKGQG